MRELLWRAGIIAWGAASLIGGVYIGFSMCGVIEAGGPR